MKFYPANGRIVVERTSHRDPFAAMSCGMVPPDEVDEAPDTIIWSEGEAITADAFPPEIPRGRLHDAQPFERRAFRACPTGGPVPASGRPDIRFKMTCKLA